MKKIFVQEDTTAKKTAALVSGLLLMLCTGIIYMWSVFQPYVVDEFVWSAGDVSMTSSIMIAMFVVGNIIGGMMQEKCRPRVIAFAGIIMFTMGIYMTSLLGSSNSPWLFYLTYSIIAGLGSGLAYTTVLSSLQKWYAANTGLITGLTVSAFALSVVCLSPVVEKMLSVFSVSMTFRILSVAFTFIGLFAACFISKPSPDYYMREARKVMGADEIKQYAPTEMVRTPMFWIIIVALFSSSAAYLMLVPFIKTISLDRGMSSNLAIIAVMITGVANAAGRILVPALSDKIGRTMAMGLCGIISAVACIMMISATNFMYLLAVFLIAFAFGGAAGTNPVLSTKLFGAKNSGINYGIILISVAASSIVFGKISASVGTSSSDGFTIVFIICAVVSLVTTLAMVAMETLCKKQGVRA